MTREELEKIVEENEYIYILNNDGKLLRAKQCAFFGGLTEESALAYYESVKENLGGDIEIKTTKLALNDISSLGALYMGENYPNFFIAEYGPLPTDLLYTIRQESSKKSEIYSSVSLQDSYYILKMQVRLVSLRR